MGVIFANGILNVGCAPRTDPKPNEANGSWDLQPREQQHPVHPFGDVNTR